MISFIVIGKNEGIKIGKCIDSILDFCSSNNILSYELIYVDSDSKDNSISYAKTNCAKIIKISGDINAAVARNEGAKLALGEILFFIDGDMELISDFYSYAFNSNKLIYPFLSGFFINNYHDKNGTFLFSETYRRSKPKDNDEFQVTTGGLFIIDLYHWKILGGMDTKFTTGEDLDFGLRSSKAGFKLLRINKPLAHHNTIHYGERLKLFNKNEIFGRAVLYRKHLLNKHIYRQILFRDPSFVILLSSSPIYIFSCQMPVVISYLIAVLILSLITNFKNPNKIPIRFIYQVCRDSMNLLALIFYYPQEKNMYQVTPILA